MKHALRNVIAPSLVAPVMRASGFRFSKEWRHAERGLKAFMYRHVISTVIANIKAGE